MKYVYGGYKKVIVSNTRRYAPYLEYYEDVIVRQLSRKYFGTATDATNYGKRWVDRANRWAIVMPLNQEIDKQKGLNDLWLIAAEMSLADGDSRMLVDMAQKFWRNIFGEEIKLKHRLVRAWRVLING